MRKPNKRGRTHLFRSAHWKDSPTYPVEWAFIPDNRITEAKKKRAKNAPKNTDFYARIMRIALNF